MQLQPIQRLSILGQYQQARRQASIQREADGLPTVTRRLHLVQRGGSILVFLQSFKPDSFTSLPSVPSAYLSDPKQLAELLKNAARSCRRPVHEIEVVLHVGSGFQLDQINTSRVTGDVPLSVLLETQPARVLVEPPDAATIARKSWIDIPESSQAGLAHVMERRVFTALAEALGAVSTSGLFRLTVIPSFISTIGLTLLMPGRDHDYMIWIVYDDCSVFASVEGMRVTAFMLFAHDNGKLPQRLTEHFSSLAVSTVSDQHKKPSLMVVSCSGSFSQNNIIEHMQQRYREAGSMTPFNPDSIHFISDASEIRQDLGGLPPEIGFWVSNPSDKDNRIFSSFVRNHWSFPPDIRASILPRDAAQSFRSIRMVGMGAVLVAIVSGLLCAGFFFHSLRKPAWSIQPSDVAAIEEQATQARKSLSDHRRAARLLEPRSSGRFLIALCDALFPEGQGVTLNQVDYDAAILFPEKQTAANAQTLGWTRTITLTGEASREGIGLIDRLVDPQILTPIVTQVAQNTQSPAFDPTRKGVQIKATADQKPAAGGGVNFTMSLILTLDPKSSLAMPAR
jgi:hypothetical protein